jgi:phage protein D
MSDGSNGTRLSAARPTINLGGQDDISLESGLLSLVIAETSQGLYRCEAMFGNWDGGDFRYLDRDKLDFGKAFKIKLLDTTLFEGRITGLEAHYPDRSPPEITVLAEDRLQDLRMTRRTRSFEDMVDADVFKQIANDHGLTPSVDVTGPKHTSLAQVNQSDLAFLRDRARAIDAEVWVEDRTLYAKQRASRSRGTVKLGYRNQLHEFSVTADLSQQRSSVTVSGWDVGSKDAIKSEATDSAIQGELAGGASGASILASALGERKEVLAHVVPHTGAEAQSRAEAHFRAIARRFVVGRGVAAPDARLRVGVYVELDGLGSLFNGKYYLSEVQHLFDGHRGLRTEFTGERPSLGQPR